MYDSGEIAANYVATWNETGADRRAGLIARHWVGSPRYVDPLTSAVGVEELSAMIGQVHARFPGWRFGLIGTPDGHGNYVRFRWGLGPQDADAVVEGSDVVEVIDGKIERVVGFLDKLPTA